MKHRLTEKDVHTRTAVCSVDGPVRIYRSGPGWVCAVKHREYQSAYLRRAAARSGESANPHALTGREPEARTATCSVCGPTSIEPWGRGWICSTRARELGRVYQQDRPQDFCRDCMAADRYLIWLPTDGQCPRCAETQLARELALLEDQQRALAAAHLGPGYHLDGGDPYEMPDYESAVPGWRTIA